MPDIIHITGRKNSGKTTLMSTLVKQFSSIGLVVGTIKHTPHWHGLDRPGSDSYVHKKAGAMASAVISPERAGIFFDHEDAESAKGALMRHFEDCDILLVEGWSADSDVVFEVWRSQCRQPPRCLEQPVRALITDESPQGYNGTVIPRRDEKLIAAAMLNAVGREGQ